MSNLIAINGSFTVHQFGGQERYSYNIIEGLDKLASKDEFELIVPLYAEEKRIPKLKNITIKRIGSAKFLLWEQTTFYFYLKKNNRIGYNPRMTCPILKPDIASIHDVVQMAHPEWFTGIYGRLSTCLHNTMYYSAAKKSPLIITSSYFSKEEMRKYLHINSQKVVVTGDGWEHFQAVKESSFAFYKFKMLEPKKYYLSASSLTPQKNFKWIKEAAINNPAAIFAIIGEKAKISQKEDSSIPPNMYYLGFLTDGEMKSLMRNCKAFIHPAKYEGFGITPLEAMSVGAKVILANASCLPEIYGDAALYIDPDNAEVDLDELLKQPVGDSSKVLEKYTWTRMAKIVYDALSDMTIKH